MQILVEARDYAVTIPEPTPRGQPGGDSIQRMPGRPYLFGALRKELPGREETFPEVSPQL